MTKDLISVRGLLPLNDKCQTEDIYRGKWDKEIYSIHIPLSNHIPWTLVLTFSPCLQEKVEWVKIKMNEWAKKKDGKKASPISISS